MKDRKGLSQAYYAKARQAVRSIDAIHDTLAQGTCIEDLGDSDMAYMRRHVAELTQAFHEMNAYRNALLT